MLMSYVWIALWLVFALAVFTVLGWSINITLAQNKAWSEFAAKYKLIVKPKLKMLDPVTVEGILNGRHLKMYVSNEVAKSKRTMSVYSHVEVVLNHNPGVRMIIAKQLMSLAWRDVTLPQVFNAPGIDWVLRETDDPYAMANWLNPARVQAINNYFASAGPGDEPIFISTGEQGFLVWRTVDPLRDPRALNALVQKLYGFAKDLDGDAPVTIAKANPPSEPTPAIPVSTT